MKQRTFADLEYDAKKKRTRREKFLDEMNQVVPWARWLALIEPHYPKGATAHLNRKSLTPGRQSAGRAACTHPRSPAPCQPKTSIIFTSHRASLSGVF